MSLAAGVDGDTAVGEPLALAGGDENTLDYSTATKVVVTDSAAALVWFQQQNGEPYELKALVQALPENTDPEPGPEDDFDRVMAQRFDDGGDALADAFLIHEEPDSTDAGLGYPRVAASDDGRLLVGWGRDETTVPVGCSDSLAISRVGADDSVSAARTPYDSESSPCYPAVGMDADGDHLAAVWVSRNGNQPQAARGTVITAAGEVIGERGTRFADFSDIDVMRPTGDPKVALSDELAVVAWQGTAGDQAVLRAKVTGNALSSGDDDSAQDSFDHDNGGAAGLLTLLGLGLLRLRRRSRR